MTPSRRPPSPRGARTPIGRGRIMLLGLLIGLAGCDGREPAGARVLDDHGTEAADSIALATDGAEPADDEDAASRGDPPDEVYYDLTAFDWYRKGEPLNVGGRPYRPAGEPEAGRARRFEPAGEYQRVTYYVEEDAAAPYAAVFVPVAPRYWLRFVAPEGQPQP